MGSPSIDRHVFGTTSNGESVTAFVLSNSHGAKATFLTIGAALRELFIPDREGRLGDVVLGYDDVAGYEANSPHFGGIVGRIAGRIANSEFELDGRTIRVSSNTPPDQLHGGHFGYDHRVWRAEGSTFPDGAGLELRLHDPDGWEGFPGSVEVLVKVKWSDDFELSFDFCATPDQPTPIDMTHHGYFNLAAGAAPTILNHWVTIPHSNYLPLGPSLLATGEIAPVAGTPYDFREPHQVGERVHLTEWEPKGYDRCWVLDRAAQGMILAGTVRDEGSGRVVEAWTDAPALQFYSGNFLDGTVVGKGGVKYPQYAGLCLETQSCPGALSHSNFPSVIVRPPDSYRQQCAYRFRA